MKRRRTALITSLLLTLLVTGCSSISDKNWTHLIPEETTFVVIPEEGLSLSSLVSTEYASYLDDLTPSAVQQVASLDSVVSPDLTVRALILYPTTSSASHLVWITQDPSGSIENWAYRYYEPFAQNKYRFGGFTVHKLYYNKNYIYATQAGSWLVVSESSLALENTLRSYNGEIPFLSVTEEETRPGSFIVNVPGLDAWAEQFAAVANRPSIHKAFAGGSPVDFDVFSTGDSLQSTFGFEGQMSLSADTHSVLIDALSFENREISLDRYIAGNAAAFALLRLPPVSVPAEPDDRRSYLDSLMLADLNRYQRLASALDHPFAFVAFQESGLLNSGEYLYLRKLTDPGVLKTELDQLADDGRIYKTGNTYQVNSRVLALLIGSELTPFNDFYLSITGDVAAIAKRKGLAEGVESDRRRRRVIYYDETYKTARNQMPGSVSGFVWTDSDAFLQFIQPFLKADNLAGAILNRFDVGTIQLTRQNSLVNISMNTYKQQGSSLPYEELWVMPLSGADISGAPVLGNLVGSIADEVVFSTSDGQIIALAADGTLVAQMSTEGQTPVGSPIIYDWYGNGQPVIMQAAGNRIFAWNENGSLLPNFPFILPENISAPVLVADVVRNGIPEIVVATQDRKVHVLDGRGDNLDGWPQNTNAVIQSQPVLELVNGAWSVWAFSENALHSWVRTGNPRPGYPQFINARFTGSPVFYNNQVLGTSADGHLYSVGRNPLFADSLSDYVSEDSIKVKSLYVANNELNRAGIEYNVLLKDSTEFYREDLIATQSQSGSVFLYNTDGVLRFTQSLGQPVSGTFTPQLADINGDDDRELLVLAEFGRLYAWEVLTGLRLYGLPTSGMRYPLLTDLNGDGRIELMAQTREGLRCWTINRAE